MMPPATPFLLGEFPRTLDERFRLTLPSELADRFAVEGEDCVLAKERPGALSLWAAANWEGDLEKEVAAVEALLKAGRLKDRTDWLQTLGRLMSTRHRRVQLQGRARLLIPEGFREFLGAEPGGEVFVVGAALCVEIWRPDAWINYIKEHIPQFRQIVNQLLEKRQ